MSSTPAFGAPRLRISYRSTLIYLALIHLAILAWLLVGFVPGVAHAQAVTGDASGAVADPTGLITALVTAVATVFPGVARYLPTILLLVTLVGGLCATVTVFVPPPSTASPRWWIALYKVINVLAANAGHARNATIPGMQPEVRDASIAAAKLTAAAPGLAVVAATTAIPKPVIGPGS